MSDFSQIIQEINTNLPDNNTQSITAAKLRTTLIDLTDTIDTVQDDFENGMNSNFEELSTSVETALDNIIVDNLSSTSTTTALSANQGRIINDRLIDVEEQVYYWDENTLNTNIFYANGIKGGMSGSQAPYTWSVSTSQTGYARHYAVPVEAGQIVTVTANATNFSRIAFFNNQYDNTTVPVNGSTLPLVGGDQIFTIQSGVTQSFTVPENAVWICFNTGGSGQYVPSSVIIRAKTDSEIVFTDGVVNNTNSYEEDQPLSANQGRILGEKLKDISIITDKITDYTVEGGYVLGTTGDIGGDEETYKHAVITLSKDMYSLRFYAQTIGGSANTGSAFYDENGSFLIGYKFPTRTGSTNEITEVTLNIPFGAKYLKTTIQSSLMVASNFYCYATSGLTITDKVYEGVSKYITLSNTYIFDDGHIVSSPTYVTTSPIFGGHGFYLELNEDYRVLKAVLFNIDGTMVDPTYIPYNLSGPTYNGYWPNRKWFSTLTIPQQYYLKLVIRNINDGTSISPDENVIKEFCYLDDNRLLKETINEPYYAAAKNRLAQVSNLILRPKNKIIASEVSTSTQIPSSTNDYFFYPSKVRMGVPYSEAIQYSKLVGLQVTPYTFLTAMNNKRSLMYTEAMYNNTSEYGINYTGGSIHYYTSYFGIICTGLTGFTLGLPTFYHTEFYTKNGTDEGIDGMSRVQIPEGSTAFDTVQLLDIIYYSGHCSIVSDIYKDEFGNRKYVVWAESLRPTPFITGYNKEQFNSRFSRQNCRIYRLDPSKIGLGSTIDSSYIQLNWYDYPNNIKFNNDICTFAGDRATFATGDIIYLNLNRTPGYTNLEIYKDESGTPLYNIDITNTTTYPSDNMYDDNEDWVKFNLTTYNLGQGKYKARLIGTDIQSDFTYFEIVDLSLSYTISESNTIISFGATGATPISLNCCSAGGYSHYIHTLTSEEISAGQSTRDWDYSYNTATKYIRLIARGEYGGVAIKNVEVV
jgi:hypothetical protein